ASSEPPSHASISGRTSVSQSGGRLISPLRIAYSWVRLIRTSRARLGRSRPLARQRRRRSAQKSATGSDLAPSGIRRPPAVRCCPVSLHHRQSSQQGTAGARPELVGVGTTRTPAPIHLRQVTRLTGKGNA